MTYKIYPSKGQIERLEEMLVLHQRLYNAALEERISAWRTSKTSISYVDQAKSLTDIRKDFPEYRGLNAQSCQATLKKLDRAFKAFFKRCQAGQTPGFPRFKSQQRFNSFSFNTHGDGFKFVPRVSWASDIAILAGKVLSRHGSLHLSGVGWMHARGEARTPGIVKCMDVMRKVDGWFVSMVVACEPARALRDDAYESGAIDTGNEKRLTVAFGMNKDEVVYFPNERLGQHAKDAIVKDQRQLSKDIASGKVSKRSKRTIKRKKVLAKRHRKLGHRRLNQNHQDSAKVSVMFHVLAGEKVGVKNMTRSAKGTLEEPGRQVKQKAGLNRETLDTAQARFLDMVAYKAAEAGCDFTLVPTRSLKPSQRCPLSWRVKKKDLGERTHTLPDGTVLDRDHAACLVMQRFRLEQLGREPAWLSV